MAFFSKKAKKEEDLICLSFLEFEWNLIIAEQYFETFCSVCVCPICLAYPIVIPWHKKIENHWLEGEAQNPEALESIKNMEFMKSSMALGDGQPLEVDFGLPTFTSHINDVNCEEGQSAMFECSVEPKTDPSLQTGKSRKIVTLDTQDYM